MSFLPKPRLDHLEEGLGSWSLHLQHDGQDGEDDNLNGGSTRIPIWPTDPILQFNVIIIEVIGTKR